MSRKYERVTRLANQMLMPFNLKLTEIRRNNQGDDQKKIGDVVKEEIGDAVRRVEE